MFIQFNYTCTVKMLNGRNRKDYSKTNIKHSLLNLAKVCEKKNHILIFRVSVQKKKPHAKL